MVATWMRGRASAKTIMIQGATSDAGKSALATG
jgi:hypothetical protein